MYSDHPLQDEPLSPAIYYESFVFAPALILT